MEKLILKGKKEIKNLLVDSLHQTIQMLGVAKSSMKVEKLIKGNSKKLAALVGKQLKKDQKRVNKMKSKTQRKKENHSELVTA